MANAHPESHTPNLVVADDIGLTVSVTRTQTSSTVPPIDSPNRTFSMTICFAAISWMTSGPVVRVRVSSACRSVEMPGGQITIRKRI